MVGDSAKLQELFDRMGVTTSDKSTKVVTTAFVKDCSKAGVVPFRSGELKKSVYASSDFSTGHVVWSKDYAEDVYKKNVTGIEEWDIETWKENEEKYMTYLEGELDKEFQGLIGALGLD